MTVLNKSNFFIGYELQYKKIAIKNLRKIFCFNRKTYLIFLALTL